MVVLTSLGPPEEGIRLEEKDTRAFFNDRCLGDGTLFISESRVSWVGSGSERGFSLEYPHIALHAVSKDLSAFPSECIYLMIDVRLLESEGTSHGSSSSSEEGESDTGMTEVRFVPQDKSRLTPMFSAISQCQALHPDPEDISSEGEEDEEDENGSLDDGLFEDAEEDEELMDQR